MFVAVCVSMLLGAGPLVHFQGKAICPTADEVSARLSDLLPAPAPSPSREPDRVELDDMDRSGSFLRVTLRRPDGRVIARRWLARTYSCADLAAAAALVIATWESDVIPSSR